MRYFSWILQVGALVLGTCLTNFAAAQLENPVLLDPVDVHRAQWDARTPKPDISTYQSYGLDKPKYSKIVLHSTDMGYGVGVAEAQKIQNYEMDHMRFSDIGYNFLIDSEGTIFEGRELTYVPSHAGESAEANATHDIRKDPDYGSIGIAFSSDANSPISAKQLRAAKKLIDFFVQHPRFQVNEVITHAEVAPQLRAKHLTPVGDFDPHVCPGDQNLEALVSLRRSLQRDRQIPFNENEFRNLFRTYVKPQAGARMATPMPYTASTVGAR